MKVASYLCQNSQSETAKSDSRLDTHRFEGILEEIQNIEGMKMIKIRKILHPTDFSASAEQAMRIATNLARAYNAQLHLLHAVVFYNPADYFQDLDSIYNHLKNAAAKQMQSYIEAAGAADLQIEQVNVPAISAGSMITGYVNEYEIDLIVMGTHGRSGISHLLMGSIAEEVVQAALCPVLTVKASSPATSEFQRIVVPIDFSDHSTDLLLYAKELAAKYGSELHLIHVVEQPIYPTFYAFDTAPITDILGRIKASAEEKLREMSAGMEAQIHVLEGKPTRLITEFATQIGASLIVIATHGLTGLDHMLLGSVTEKVVRRANCPVLTIKSFGRSLLA